MASHEMRIIPFADVSPTVVPFGGSQVKVYAAPEGTRMDIEKELADPAHFFGDPRVDFVVQFGPAFDSLIGEDSQRAQWDKLDLPSLGIYVFEERLPRAKELAEIINGMAAELTATPALYDDATFSKKYWQHAKESYTIMRNNRLQQFGAQAFRPESIPVSLERGGLVSTRLGLDFVHSDSLIPNEVQVVTKRTLFQGEPSNYLTVPVTIRDWEKFKALKGADAAVYDFVNPASGASTAAFLLAAQAADALPGRLEHHAIAATTQGIRFNREAIRALGIDAVFEALFVASVMNEQYYLVGGRAVGDAGHILRHYLPIWYKDPRGKQAV